MRILQVRRPQEIKRIMQEIRVDPYGIEIMYPKGAAFLIKLNSIPSVTANILKQEMLSLGADVAVSRDALTGKAKHTDCLLLGNLSVFDRLVHKLNRQPFGLSKLAGDLGGALKNYQKENFVLNLGGHRLDLKSRTHIMGIVNLTPDSFSGDGVYGKKQLDDITEYIELMVADGADIIDVGGESSRPGARPVPLKEELERTMPVIKKIAGRIKVPVSIDTYKFEVAKKALECGAAMVNDITGLKDRRMAKIIARYKAGVVIMHMRGTPRTMQKNPRYSSLIDEIIDQLRQAVERAKEAGISGEKIIIDPGIGFAKTKEHNLEILNRLGDFKVLGLPILVGPSRKSFIGKILNAGLQDRIYGTISSCVLAARNGAHIVRVHDVLEVKQALAVSDSVNKICLH